MTTLWKKIYKFANLQTKQELKKVGGQLGREFLIQNFVKRTALQFPCFRCMLELCVYYAEDCRQFVTVSDKRVVAIGYKEVKNMQLCFEK